MLFTKYIVFAGTALATAIPADAATPGPKQFAVTNFVFGCSASCAWSFDLAVQGTGPNHPAVNTPVKCSGNLDENTDYVDCGTVSNTQKLKAYIVKATDKLMIQYEVQKPKQNKVFRFTGEKDVYASTSKQAKLQKSSFIVKESGATGVA